MKRNAGDLKNKEKFTKMGGVERNCVEGTQRNITNVLFIDNKRLKKMVSTRHIYIDLERIYAEVFITIVIIAGGSRKWVCSLRNITI